MARMRNSRLGLIAIAALVLAIFVGQNSSRSLGLTFLGMQTIALPLSVWVVLAIAVGVATSWAIVASFRWYGAPRGAKPPPRQSGQVESPPPPRGTYWGRQPEPEPAPEPEPQPQPEVWEDDDWGEQPNGNLAQNEQVWQEAVTESQMVEQPADEDLEPEGDREEIWDDWEEEWESEEEPIDTVAEEVEPHRDRPINLKQYEVPQEPVSSSWEGSIYSYSYRQPQKSGVGRIESVYDRDEPAPSEPEFEDDEFEEEEPEGDRVLVPPPPPHLQAESRAPAPTPDDEEEDEDFEDEKDDWDDDDWGDWERSDRKDDDW